MARRKFLTDRRTGDPGLLKHARNRVFRAITHVLDTADPHIRELRAADRFHRISERQQRRHTQPPRSVWRADGRMKRKQVRRVRRKYGRNLREKLFG